MKPYLESLRERILTEGVLDPEDMHHEFVSGMHGRKLDFDRIETASSLYEDWTDAFAEYIRTEYQQQPNALIGVANGANRLALSIAAKLKNGAVGLITEKDTPKSAKPVDSSLDYLSSYKPDFVLVIEDVGTSGTSSASVCRAVIEAGAKKVEVLNTWQRREQLEKLDEAGFSYQAMIKEVLPTYAPEACDYCANGVKLIER